MARYTKVYSGFISRLKEVDLLQSKAAKLQRPQEPLRHGDEMNALCRGSILLLSSHVEAYIKELGEHTIDMMETKSTCRSCLAPQFFYHISKNLVDNISSSSQPEKIAYNVFTFLEKKSDIWKSEGPFPYPVSTSCFNSSFSNPTFDKVNSYFRRFGYESYKHDFKQALGRDANNTQNNLNQLVNLRNAIAHGDPSATKTPNEVKEAVIEIRKFCRVTDSVFSSWCKQKLCPIR